MNCDLIAPWYRFLEYLSFGSALQRRRCHFLPLLGDARKVLMLGEGDGRFLAEFAARNPTAEIDYIDMSAKMLRLAESRRKPGSRSRFHRLNVLSDPIPGNAYDLIITHFFLDCFTCDELTRLLPKIGAAAAPSTRWIVSEFREPDHGWRRLRARTWIYVLYLAFRFVTGLKTQKLPDYAEALSAAGFHLQVDAIASAGLLTSQMWVRHSK